MKGTTPKCKRCGIESIRGFSTPTQDICFECYDRLKQLIEDMEFINKKSQ
jgi:hypothetical protein